MCVYIYNITVINFNTFLSLSLIESEPETVTEETLMVCSHNIYVCIRYTSMTTSYYTLPCYYVLQYKPATNLNDTRVIHT